QKVYLYTLNFNRQATDVIKLLPVQHGPPEFKEGIEIDRQSVLMEIKPTFEGQSVPYYEQKPEVTLDNNKLSNKSIFRLKSTWENQTYIYVSYYSEECSQWQPLPVACHMSDLDIKPQGNVSISCKADSVTVTECDDIVNSLSVSRVLQVEN
ncbi:MAG: hypothetical protein ACD_77C00129G0001, partial [uncultured bacterium]